MYSDHIHGTQIEYPPNLWNIVESHSPWLLPGDSKSHSSLCHHRLVWDAGDVNAEHGFDWYDDSGVAIETRWTLQHL